MSMDIQTGTAPAAILPSLEDRKVPPRLRRLALVAFARAGGRGALKDIQRFALDEDPQVAEGALRSLGWLGEVQTLAMLEEVKRKELGHLRDQAAFSAALIAHRLGLEGHDLPRPSSAKLLSGPELGILVKARPADPQEMARAFDAMERHALGIRKGQALQLECGPRRQMLLFDAAALEPWDAESYGQRKRYIGQLASCNPTTGTYSPGLTLLSTPTGALQFEAGLYRSSGQLIYGGRGEVQGQTVRFSMRSVERPGASPCIIEGAFGPAGLELTIESGVRRAVPRRVPTATAARVV